MLLFLDDVKVPEKNWIELAKQMQLVFEAEDISEGKRKANFSPEFSSRQTGSSGIKQQQEKQKVQIMLYRRSDDVKVELTGSGKWHHVPSRDSPGHLLSGKWRKNLVKQQRNFRDSYISSSKTKKVFEAKKLLPPCTENCKLECFNKNTENDRKNIFDKHCELKDLQKQCYCLAASIDSRNPKCRTLHHSTMLPAKRVGDGRKGDQTRSERVSTGAEKTENEKRSTKRGILKNQIGYERHRDKNKKFREKTYKERHSNIWNSDGDR
ncbi:hypothetical protein ILUMI_02847 [Ignelater luminosus]|uniref:Uncharacterized protein n=1 Tax=Ignelater luminosus TaxID=2038154 RepID=A0A8K0DCP1_IGNLU|nr:hypothetical protein ILUMI_02847 [Ignelater luminosus]